MLASADLAVGHVAALAAIEQLPALSAFNPARSTARSTWEPGVVSACSIWRWQQWQAEHAAEL